MLGVGLAALLQPLGEWSARIERRRRMYARAEARARQLGRQLVVIGDPGGGVTHGGYGYGDVCIDLTGCPTAPPNVIRIAANLSDGVSLPSGKFVVFVCYVLELVPDIDAAWREVVRLAGDESNVFVLALHPTREMATHYYPGIRWWITSAPPNGPLVYRSAVIPRRLVRRF